MLEATKATPIVPWIGGKRRLAKHILPLFPEHACYVEPSCGVAALYFLKAPAKVEVINDINGELVNLCRIVRHHHHHPQSGWGVHRLGQPHTECRPEMVVRSPCAHSVYSDGCDSGGAALGY